MPEHDKLTVHCFRMTCGKNWANHLPMNVVRELMGHASITTTAEFYSKVCGEHEAQAKMVGQAMLAGAVCPVSGQSVGLLAPYQDTNIVNQFLAQFAGQLTSGVHAVMIWDQAGFYTPRALKVPANVTLIKLPPYSPKLNPVENL